jgi:hypothetical protein
VVASSAIAANLCAGYFVLLFFMAFFLGSNWSETRMAVTG